jgi:hypothetical protein
MNSPQTPTVITSAVTSTAVADSLVMHASQTDASIRVFEAQTKARLTGMLSDANSKRGLANTALHKAELTFRDRITDSISALVLSSPELKALSKALGAVMRGKTTPALLVNRIDIPEISSVFLGKPITRFHAQVTLNCEAPMMIGGSKSSSIDDLRDGDTVYPYGMGKPDVKSIGVKTDGWVMIVSLTKQDKTEIANINALHAEVKAAQTTVDHIETRIQDLPKTAQQLRVSADMATLQAGGDAGRGLLASALLASDKFVGETKTEAGK